MKIVVIGGGTIGANIAYRLGVEGADVTLIEARAPGSGTSGASFSWLSSFPQVSWNEDAGRAKLRLTINETFEALHAEIGGEWLDWSGTITYGAAAPDFRRSVAACLERGIDLRIIDRHELAQMTPGLSPGPDDDAFVYEPRSGWVDAPAMIERLVEALRGRKGRVLTGRSVAAITIKGDVVKGVVLDDGSAIEADAVVNAAGSWASHVSALAGLAVPLDLVPGVMIYARGASGALPEQVINGPDWLMRPDPGGKVAIHWRGEGLTAIHGGNGSDPAAMVADIACHVPALREGAIEDVRIGIRAIPHGGPVLGALPWLPGFYLAVSHGGVGWGPIWGRLAATELLKGETVSELSGMRPDRFYMQAAPLGRFADDAEQV
ncbi:FAD-binding oxidoreductase [Pelagibacterium sp. 26DY04]|uniref:NAD(P)/FAD-dependent oxidoreductase n=1 Tax=Pelagibacterium sp. 26DY04 TaxID=2967130 RepID=UPI002815B475|nr:FAD-dependent oxidoreductase [Pelagibacterium sp. 26DY04]WMT86784.1 FAD-binding oxidoreductase [Pelagibacterium sp. 26DY04]